MRPASAALVSVAALLVTASGACAQATTNPAAQPPAQTPTQPGAQPGGTTPASTTNRPTNPAEPAIPATPRTGPARVNWWNDRVFYQIFVRSFADSREGSLASDGIGDLRGLIERLDHLRNVSTGAPNDLGVGGLWLLPIHPSPSYHGYDITDYYGVNPQYGSLDDLRTLLAECKKRDIRLVLDLVLNHTSSQIPWFQEALDPKSPKRDWYIWQETNPGWTGPWNQKVWHSTALAKVPGGGRLPAGAGSTGPFYYGIFSHVMPDLNFRNPDVTKQMLDVARFWIKDVGVDGYRLDAIRHLVEDGPIQENTQGTRDWLRTFSAFCKEQNPDAITIGEVWTPSHIASTYVPDQMDLVFEFDLAEAMTQAADKGIARHVIEAMDKIVRLYPPNQYATFLSNHDQTRIGTRLKSDPGKLRAAAQMLLTLPGVPFIYYGEEIGMTGDKPDENLRTPMQWDDTAGAGFTLADPWRKPNADYTTRNVKTQAPDFESLMQLYRKFIVLRRQNPALGYGTFIPVMSDEPSVLSFIRHADKVVYPMASGQMSPPTTQTILITINLGPLPVNNYALSLHASPLRGSLTSIEVANNGLSRPPRLDRDGGFNNYRPFPVLAPRVAYVTVLETVDPNVPVTPPDPTRQPPTIP